MKNENNITVKVKNIIKRILFLFPPRVIHSLYFYTEHKERINWKNPRTYDEKIYRLIVDMKGKDYTKYVDKLAVYDYVRECGLTDLLIPVLGVYDNPEDIRYAELPSKFIIKATHGSGGLFYVICTDKQSFDIEAAATKLKTAMRKNYAKDNYEYQYYNLRPRIMVQKLLEAEGQERLTDYKVVCAGGCPRCILVCGRDGGKDYYSTDWKYLDYVKEEYRSGITEPEPECLQQMLEAAEVLSAPLRFARVDFYIVENRLWFGEITLTPSAGNHKNLNMKGQLELGKLIK